jgi:hypothetical protein
LRRDFLNQHGTWWHHSDRNRLVLKIGDEIAGYCAVIPTKVSVMGSVHSALWWVDLVIAPEFRGRGLQMLFDQRVREMADLILGFPNEMAANIHRKHAWGVRGDMQVALLPLIPGKLKTIRRVEGVRGKFMRIGALGLNPLAYAWRAWLTTQRPQRSWKMEKVDMNVLSGIFTRSIDDRVNTTWRDTAYFEWRYGSAPQSSEYSYFLAGRPERPSHYLISHHLTHPDGFRHTRILDLFGDFRDTDILYDLFVLAVQDAVAKGSSQVIVMITRPELRKLVDRLWFSFSAPARFCWWSSSSALMAALAGDSYWVFGDSDNDAPD